MNSQDTRPHHTRGRLTLDAALSANTAHYLRDADGRVIASVSNSGGGGIPSAERRANAAELARRWNAWEPDGVVAQAIEALRAGLDFAYDDRHGEFCNVCNPSDNATHTDRCPVPRMEAAFAAAREEV